MIHAQRNLRLYLGNRGHVLGVPLGILAAVVGLSLIIGALMGLAGAGLPLTSEVSEGTRYNGGAIYGLPGFLISLGALAMNRYFALALAMGSSRRSFWVGTSAGFMLTSVLTAAFACALLAIERVTDYWFLGVHVLDVYVLGSKGYGWTFLAAFVVCLFGLYLGAFFGTVFRAFGATWTAVAVAIYVVMLAGLLAILIKYQVELAPFFDGLGSLWWLPFAAVLMALTAGASYALNQRATI
ncbi:MAG: hypothetical protein V9E81_00940 [Marmoricola sp.]|jgi:hypothetical protein